MACGNSDVSRSHLSSPPVAVAQKLGRLASHAATRFKAPQEMPARKVNIYVNEDGSTVRHDRKRHVHVVLNADMKGGKPTGIVMVLVTDKTADRQMGELHFTPKRLGDGTVTQPDHHELTVFFRPPSPEQLEKAVREAAAILKSRPRGSR